MGRILLVDDDADMMRLCANWLKKAGHEVFTETSGEAALDFLASEKVDLILLDYAMPGMNGPDTFAEIKKNDTLKNIPVLFRTGMEDDDTAGIMSSLSPAGVIPKSEGKAALIKAVDAQIGAH